MKQIEFYMREAAFWEDQAEKLAADLEQIKTRMNEIGYPEIPPEPPVGTKFYNENDELAWEHQPWGWFCPRDDCGNCPEWWGTVWEQYVGHDRMKRVLPLDSKRGE